MHSTRADWTYASAFDRNIGLIPGENQKKLQEAHVAIAGLGGVGGIYATTLARLGVGNFSIADFDSFEHVNMNRQQGAYLSTVGKRKNETMERMIKDINPEASVRVFDTLSTEVMGDFLLEATIAFDGLDFFVIAPRRLLYREARACGIPVFNAAPIGFGSAMLNFSPTGMSFDEYFAITDDMSEKEQVLQFAIGMGPRMLQRAYFAPEAIDFTHKRAPSSVLGTLAAANMAVCEAYKVIMGLPYASAPVSWHFDPYVRKFKRCNLWWGNRNPIQRLKKWYLKRTLPSL